MMNHTHTRQEPPTARSNDGGDSLYIVVSLSNDTAARDRHRFFMCLKTTYVTKFDDMSSRRTSTRDKTDFQP